jgi:hypothetical protein
MSLGSMFLGLLYAEHHVGELWRKKLFTSWQTVSRELGRDWRPTFKAPLPHNLLPSSMPCVLKFLEPGLCSSVVEHMT